MCIVCEIKADLSKTKATAEQASALMAKVETLAKAMGSVIDVAEAVHARKPDVFTAEELATIAQAEELFAQSEALPPLAAALLGALLGGSVKVEVASVRMKPGESPEDAIERFVAEREAQDKNETKH